ncbi:MAG: hypothetical protein IH624_12820 [Phycisphaerae bacterium]|nr:hypothetical protein [Phycisphaerae bacterium]
MKNAHRTLCPILAGMLMACLPAQGRAEFRDLYSDTWVAADALGRTLPGYEECGPPRKDRTVGIFYFLWLGQHGVGGPYDITAMLADNPDDPKYGPPGAFHHWDQAELGYYLSDSEYVIRKHVSMLVDAQIDTLIFDVTNGPTYNGPYMTVCKVFTELRNAGRPTPQICFLTHSHSAQVITRIYNDFYAKNLYPDLWFRWKGKPLILGPAENLDPEIRDFFTIRDCWAWTHGKDTWQWLDHTPQKYGWHESPDKPEEVSVSAAQHPTSNIGRSFQNGKQPPHDKYARTDTMHLGLYFDEQWKSALKTDPQFIFITGWNEWVAQRFITTSGQHFLGRPLPDGGTFFVDQYSQEFSRDIEPMAGGHTDNYYYQMIAGIRRYKGVRPPPTASPPKTITVDGDFSDWTDVRPEYRDTIGDTLHRSERGWGSAGTYTNTTGRNDFVAAKVACDAAAVYFYIQTADAVTPRTDPNWMLLFIDADCDPATGWHGYDYVVNRSVVDDMATTLAHTDGRWNWKTVAQLPYRVRGSEMEIRIPRNRIGQEAKIAFDFHWADNIQKEDDIIEFAVSGDSAPNRRFNYRYQQPAK